MSDWQSRDYRKADRLSVSIPGTLRLAGMPQKFPIDVLDLSVTGFRAATSWTLNIGDQAFLTVPTFTPFEAKIAWRNGVMYGFAFNRALHQSVFDLVVARHKAGMR